MFRFEQKRVNNKSSLRSPGPFNSAVRNKTPPNDFWRAKTIRPESKTFCRTVRRSRIIASVAVGGAAGLYWEWQSCVAHDRGPDYRSVLAAAAAAAAAGGPARDSGGCCSASNGQWSNAVCCSRRSRPFSACCDFRRHYHCLLGVI